MDILSNELCPRPKNVFNEDEKSASNISLNLAQIWDESQSGFLSSCVLQKESVAMKEKLEAMETMLTDTQTRLLNSESQIGELKNQANMTVIFSATLGESRAIGPFTEDTTLMYRTVITNIGNAYSSFTGIFTAPVVGVYDFTIFYHAGGEHEGKLMLYKNNQLIAVTNDDKSESDTAGGNAVFLQQGDQVYVRLAAKAHVWGHDYHTSFSGFLVTQI